MLRYVQAYRRHFFGNVNFLPDILLAFQRTILVHLFELFAEVCLGPDQGDETIFDG